MTHECLKPTFLPGLHWSLVTFGFWTFKTSVLHSIAEKDSYFKLFTDFNVSSAICFARLIRSNKVLGSTSWPSLMCRDFNIFVTLKLLLSGFMYINSEVNI